MFDAFHRSHLHADTRNEQSWSSNNNYITAGATEYNNDNKYTPIRAPLQPA